MDTQWRDMPHVVIHKGDGMKYAIWCRVSGGVTGTREAWLKSRGIIRKFETLDEAQRVAAEYNVKFSNDPISKAYFSYTAKEYP